MEIRLSHIAKQYDQKMVLKDFNAVFPGERMNCLMGASGIGKTTAIHIIMGLVKPDFGEVLGCKGRRIAAVFQEDRLIEHWNAMKNIRLVCDKEVTRESIRQELGRLGIEDCDDKQVIDFSGGMRRRVAIVRALLAKSEIVILDEPFRGLDEALKLRVIDYIKEKTDNKTVIVVTHEKEDVKLLNANLVTMA